MRRRGIAGNRGTSPRPPPTTREPGPLGLGKRGEKNEKNLSGRKGRDSCYHG